MMVLFCFGQLPAFPLTGMAADTAPLEGLPILRCAIYDPLEGLQISKMRLAEMGV